MLARLIAEETLAWFVAQAVLRCGTSRLAAWTRLDGSLQKGAGGMHNSLPTYAVHRDIGDETNWR